MFSYINIFGFIGMRPEYFTVAISDTKFKCPPLILPR